MKNSLELKKQSNESLPAQVEQYLYKNLLKNVADLVINQILQRQKPKRHCYKMDFKSFALAMLKWHILFDVKSDKIQGIKDFINKNR